jgi:hypothetical protein
MVGKIAPKFIVGRQVHILAYSSLRVKKTSSKITKHESAIT